MRGCFAIIVRDNAAERTGYVGGLHLAFAGMLFFRAVARPRSAAGTFAALANCCYFFHWRDSCFETRTRYELRRFFAPLRSTSASRW